MDWISFNIQGSVDLEPITNYLFQTFGFNSTMTKRINGKWKSESFNYHRQNDFQVSFRQHEYDPETKSFWVGTKIDFSGNNALLNNKSSIGIFLIYSVQALVDLILITYAN